MDKGGCGCYAGRGGGVDVPVLLSHQAVSRSSFTPPDPCSCSGKLLNDTKERGGFRGGSPRRSAAWHALLNKATHHCCLSTENKPGQSTISLGSFNCKCRSSPNLCLVSFTFGNSGVIPGTGGGLREETSVLSPRCPEKGPRHTGKVITSHGPVFRRSAPPSGPRGWTLGGGGSAWRRASAVRDEDSETSRTASVMAATKARRAGGF